MYWKKRFRHYPRFPRQIHFFTFAAWFPSPKNVPVLAHGKKIRSTSEIAVRPMPKENKGRESRKRDETRKRRFSLWSASTLKNFFSEKFFDRLSAALGLTRPIFCAFGRVPRFRNPTSRTKFGGITDTAL